jgi:hypothetical protein
MNNRRINICRPGYGASCALCCGSHNYRLSNNEVEELFLKRGAEGSPRPYLHPYTVSFDKIYRDAMQCPHVGLSDDNEICCVIYSEPDKKGDVLSFFRGTCSNFYCPAWDVLTDKQVVFAARLMKDWFYYSLLINDIEAVQNLSASYSSPDDVPEYELEDLKKDIIERFIAEDGK